VGEGDQNEDHFGGGGGMSFETLRVSSRMRVRENYNKIQSRRLCFLIRLSLWESYLEEVERAFEKSNILRVRNVSSARNSKSFCPLRLIREETRRVSNLIPKVGGS
jgi:hypothetical protein